MKQLPLAIAENLAPTLDNFLPGANGAALAGLRALLASLPDGPAQPPVFLWGPAGCGKTHLLQALARAAAAAGAAPAWLGLERASDPNQGEGNAGVGPVGDTAGLLLLDDAHSLPAEAQQETFAALVSATQRGVTWVAAADRPPIDLPLRDDLRTRLGWGPVYGLVPLGECEAVDALRDEARRRDLRLGDEVLQYLMTRLPRELGTLMPLLARLDGFSLAEHRAVTVPLLKKMLEEEEGSLR